MNNRSLFRILAISLFLISASIISQAQATRTWVSGVGDDANPCSRTAPCKTFAGTISKTAAGGEINCLDPGGYGAVTITKSLTIDCSETSASILVSGTNAIIINSTTAKVNLRGITFNGLTTGLNAIRILEAAKVNIEDVVIDGFQNGISIENTVTVGTQVVVSRSTIRNNSAAAVNATSTGIAQVMVSDSLITGNLAGIYVTGDSVVRISGNVITNNGTGLLRSRNAQIISFLNNTIDGNTTNGTPSSTIALQ
ncbi:MAG: right-handed parallel beta-helix repeat-containing protein [Pyrinomonadaceae bacterium]